MLWWKSAVHDSAKVANGGGGCDLLTFWGRWWGVPFYCALIFDVKKSVDYGGEDDRFGRDLLLSIVIVKGKMESMVVNDMTKGEHVHWEEEGGRALNLGELHAWLRKCGTCSWWQRQSDNGRRGKKNKPEELCARDANRMEMVEEDCVINPVECGRTIKEKENGDATKVSWIWTKKFHTAEWCMMLELRYWALVMDHWRWLCRCQGCPFLFFFIWAGMEQNRWK